MSAQQGNDQKTTCVFWISRSRLGWLSVRFDGGPSYLEMVDTLEEMVHRHGYLVKRGDKISGAEWLRRIDQSDARITDKQRQAIRLLM